MSREGEGTMRDPEPLIELFRLRTEENGCTPAEVQAARNKLEALLRNGSSRSPEEAMPPDDGEETERELFDAARHFLNWLIFMAPSDMMDKELLRLAKGVLTIALESIDDE